MIINANCMLAYSFEGDMINAGKLRKIYIQTDTVNYNVHDEEISCTRIHFAFNQKTNEIETKSTTANELNIDRLFTHKNALQLLISDDFVAFLLRSVISWHKFSIVRKRQQRLDILKCLFQFIIFMQMNRFSNYDKFIMDCFNCMEIAIATTTAIETGIQSMRWWFPSIIAQFELHRGARVKKRSI